MSENCDDDYYEYTDKVASLRSTGNPLIDFWESEGNGGSTALSPDYDLILSDGNVSTMTDIHDNYFTLGSQLVPCEAVPTIYVCHNGSTLCQCICITSCLDLESPRICGPILMSTINENKINVEPNPSNGTFTIRSQSGYSENTKIEIRDALGKVVYSHNGTFQSLDVDLSSYMNGIYFLAMKMQSITNCTELLRNRVH